MSGLGEGMFALPQSPPQDQADTGADAGTVRRLLTSFVPILAGNLVPPSPEPEPKQLSASQKQQLDSAAQVMAQPSAPGQVDQQALMGQGTDNRPRGSGAKGYLKDFGSNFAMNLGDYLVQRGGGENPRTAQRVQQTQLARANQQSEDAWRQSQLQIEQQNANTSQGKLDQATQMVTVQRPDGSVIQMPFALAQKAYPALISADSREKISANQIQSRTQIEQMKEKMKSGEVSRWQPVTNADGKPVMRAYNKQGQQLFEVDDAFFPSLAQTVSSTVEYKEDANGNLVALPKTTTSQKVIPGQQPQGMTKSGQPGAPSAVTPKPVMATKNSQKMVIGIDQSGNQIMVPRGEAPQYRLSNVSEAPSADISKAIAARNWIPLASKQDSSGEASKMGMLQLVDELDKRGALGPIASRWNEFSVGKAGFGTGNPETDRLIEALRVKAGLAKTLLMNLHVGNRGGAYLFEHFEDLANAGKMNANILREGFKTELEYAKERAMLPQANTSGTSKSGGKRFVYKDGQLVPQ